MLKRIMYALGLLALLFSAITSFSTPSTSALAQGTRPEGGWNGVWQTSWTIMEYGEFKTHPVNMTLVQSGSTVTGTSNYYGWSLNGTVSGNSLTGTWSAPDLPPIWDSTQNMYIAAPHIFGQVQLTLDPSGISFSGIFKGEYHHTWDPRFVVHGEKVGYTPTPTPPPPPPPSTSKQFTGKWDTNWGEMNLSQVGNTLTGSYDYDGGKLAGTIDGTTATGTWSEAPSYQPPFDAGDFTFTLSADGKIITGQWRYGSCDWESDIRGTRGEQPPPPTPVTPTVGWSGTWDSNWGQMTLSQSGNQVTGSYAHDTGRISGTVTGNMLSGQWSEAPSYAPPDDAGDVEFTLSADGQSFTGHWRYDSSGAWSGWTGTKTSTPQPIIPTPTTLDWGDTWNTDWGEMQLSQDNEQVIGTYEYNNGQIEGTASGNILTGTWSKSLSYAEPNDLGSFEFTMSADQMSFTGNWKYASCDWNGDWDGTLIEPDITPQPIPGANQPPVASFYTSPQSPTTSDIVIATSQSSDPDGDSLSYSWSLNGVTASQYNNMPYFIWQNPAAGIYTIRLLVSDGKGGISSFQMQITVSQTPQPIPPGPTPGPNQIPIASFSVTPQFPTTSDTVIATSTSSDPDGDTLTYSWFRDGIQANEYNNMTYCIWANPAAGTHTIGIIVSDGKGGTAPLQTQITVDQSPQPQPTPGPVPGVNNPPKAYFVIEPPQPEAGDNIKIVSQSSDQDGDKLSLSWYLDGQLLDEYTDSAIWNWKRPQAGGHVMRLEVDDGKGAEDAYSKKIKIIGDATPDSNGLPKIVITIPKCFIATAAYGSPAAEELDTLRSFRDKVLLQSAPGRALVELYYEVSPPAAAFIASHEEVRTIVREVFLDPIVTVLKQTQSYWNRDSGKE
jgi:hypothetical protein